LKATKRKNNKTRNTTCDKMVGCLPQSASLPSLAWLPQTLKGPSIPVL